MKCSLSLTANIKYKIIINQIVYLYNNRKVINNMSFISLQVINYCRNLFCGKFQFTLEVYDHNKLFLLWVINR